mgnify:CR=1 FL=1|tara:strand:- start:55 stop:255 length:201 start_codon:yes stop_codon:yes gene_type:complete
MIENMIEEIQDLHLAVHQEELQKEQITERYNCRLTVLNLKAIRTRLVLLHQRMMVPQYGFANFNEL